MLTDNTDQLKIWSKTGWSRKDGWYVGYLTTNDKTWFFANHLIINKNSELPLRKQLTLDALKILEIIPQSHE
jgi:beta-lactamase class D